MNFNYILATLFGTSLFLGASTAAYGANISGAGTIAVNGSINVKQFVTDNKGTPNILDDETTSTFTFLPNVMGDASTTVRYTATELTGGFLPFAPTNALPFVNFAFGGSNTSVQISSTTPNPLLNPFTITLDPSYQIPGNTPVLDGSDGSDFIVFQTATLPVYDTNNGLTKVSIDAFGYGVSGTGQVYKAKATFTTQTTDNETTFVTKLRQPGGLNTSFSASIELEPQDVPEPMSALPLLGLGVVSLISRKLT